MSSEFENYGTQPYDQLVEKWNPVLDHDSFDTIGDSYKKKSPQFFLRTKKLP